jgi:membrane-associated phospholipid phosphatase
MRASGRAILFLLCLGVAGARTAVAQDSFQHLFPIPAQTADDASFFAVPSVTDSALAADRILLQAAPQAPPPAEPQHTGFGALVRSTASDFADFPKRKSTWVILGGGAVAAALVHPLDDNVQESWGDSTSAKNVFKLGKYLGSVYVQAGVAVGLYAIGRYALPPESGTHTNKWSHLGFDLVRSTILSQAFVLGIKYAVQRDRPTGECCAFPSGHAATTFATAAVLERHFGYRGAWPTLIAASYVGMSRLADNRHFLSDVVFGAALGTATGWTVVGRHGRENFALLPVPVRGGVALTFTRLNPDERRSKR